MAEMQDDMCGEQETSIIFNEFKHLDEFYQLFSTISNAVKDLRSEEMLLTKFNVLFGFYQEQPHLLDPFLPQILEKCIALINENRETPPIHHFVFKIIRLIMNTRGYKSLIRLMPHTVDDLEPVLDLLKLQDINDKDNWQTRYVLLLWLSIVIMVPFGLDKLEKKGKPPLIERVLSESKKHIVLDEVTQEAASYLIAKFISRPDVFPSKLEEIFLWTESVLKSAKYDSHKDQMRVAGCLRSLANICKIVPRNALFPYASRLLTVVLTLLPDDVSKNVLLARLRIKLIQRIGLLFCPRRTAAASWRYQRGFRSLADNLNCRFQPQTNASCDGQMAISPAVEPYLSSAVSVDEEEDDVDVPEEVAEAIDRLIDALRSQFTYIRWSAAKGLGRICSRLSAPFVEDVLAAILNLCTRQETFTAWHGACFALAELGRRCLLLPEKLPNVIPVVLTALFYDEKSGDCNFGSNVRDAACYCCWAFARAYRASDFSNYVHEVSQKLILSALFDRELNVRRAAAAAFQENVGRQGQFANGIEIITTVDYFAVGNISNCYLNLSQFVAGFEEYTLAIVDHLSLSRLGHWDESIRDMTARALGTLTPLAADHMRLSILPKLLEFSNGSDFYMRQGSVLGIAELIASLSQMKSFPESIIVDVVDIVLQLANRKHFQGATGELMRRACCRLIEKVSAARLPLHEHPILETWRCFLDDCLLHKEASVRDPAIPAFAAFLSTYTFAKDGSLSKPYRDMLVEHLLECLDARTESAQVGYLRVLSRAPGFCFLDCVDACLPAISACCRPNKLTLMWGNARQQALLTLTEVIKHVGVGDRKIISDSKLKTLFPILLGSLADYTIDSRGDIGSIVREAGMKALFDFSSNLVKEGRSDIIDSDTMEQIFKQVAQQAVEKIDRTRATAAQVFIDLLRHKPDLPHIPHMDALRDIFSRESVTDISWRNADSTFPLFVQLFSFTDFHYPLVLGFSVSVGGFTENTVKASSAALRSYIHKCGLDSDFIYLLMKTVSRIFLALKEHPRICLSLLKLLDFLLCDPVVAPCMEHHLPLVEQAVTSTWNHIRLSTSIPKLKSSIDIYGAALRFPNPVRFLAAQFLTQNLRHNYPIIRKTTASKLFESLLLYDMVEPDATDELSSLLTETVWEQDITQLRPVRLRICDILGVPSTRPNSVASTE